MSIYYAAFYFLKFDDKIAFIQECSWSALAASHFATKKREGRDVFTFSVPRCILGNVCA